MYSIGYKNGFKTENPAQPPPAEPAVRLVATTSVTGQPLNRFSDIWNQHETVTYREGEMILRENEIPQGLYLLKSGCVKVVAIRDHTRGRMSSPEFITRVIGPGEFFGMNASLSGTPARFFAKAVKASEVQVYPKSAVENLMSGPDSLLKLLLKQSLRDQEQAETTAQFHYLASVQERIAFQLVVLAQRFGMPTATGGLSVNLKLTRNELAQLAGTINESLSRHLTELKNEGILELNGKEIIILDLERLKKKSGNF